MVGVPGSSSSAGAKFALQPAAEQQALVAYGRLPLAFTANVGQTDARVRYYAQGGGFSVFLTRKEAMLSLPRPSKQRTRRGAALALRFLGSNRNVAVRGERAGPGRVNYLLGNDPTKWRTGLRTYERVVYSNLWPGVDMMFAGTNGKLKYEFLVRPGASPTTIRLAYRGAKGLSLDRRGNLRIRTSVGVLTDTRPVSYQLVAGKRVPVRSRFALEPHGGGYGFAVESAYDRRYPLVIDPGLVYSSYLGGNGDDYGLGIVVDGAGSAYVGGWTSSGTFPTTPGAFDTTSNGGFGDAFVTKLAASGGALVYSSYLGGTGFDFGADIALDGAGSAYLTGHTGSTDFPTTAGAFDTTLNGDIGWDAFVTKLSASGAALLYSSYLGGSGSEQGHGIAVDGAGSAYLTGGTSSTDFPTTAGAFDTTYNNGGDAFVTKLDATGGALGYSTYLGGSGWDQSEGIAVDGAGSAYLTGLTNSADFPTTAGAFDTTYNAGAAFVTKLDATGAALGYSTYLDGAVGYGIAVDGAGSAYLTGIAGPGFPTTAGAFDTTFNGGGDAFMTKLNASGSALPYSTFLGGSKIDDSRGIAVDGAGNAYVTGYTESTDFPTTPGAFDTTSNLADAFVTKLSASGAVVLYSTYLGGPRNDYGAGIAVDAGGNAYVTGSTLSETFPTTAGAFDTTSNGPRDSFVTKLDLIAGPPAPPPPPPPPPPPAASAASAARPRRAGRLGLHDRAGALPGSGLRRAAWLALPFPAFGEGGRAHRRRARAPRPPRRHTLPEADAEAAEARPLHPFRARRNARLLEPTCGPEQHPLRWSHRQASASARNLPREHHGERRRGQPLASKARQLSHCPPLERQPPTRTVRISAASSSSARELGTLFAMAAQSVVKLWSIGLYAPPRDCETLVE